MITPSIPSPLCSRRNSSTPAAALPTPSHALTIPQICRISASIGLLTAQEFLDETRPGTTSPRQSVAGMLDIPASKLLPDESVETLVAGPSPPCLPRHVKSGLHLGRSLDRTKLITQRARSETGEREVGNVGRKEGSDEVDWSEDSVNRDGKRSHICITTA